MKVLRTIIRLFRDYHPFKFFGMFALFLAMLSGGFMIPILKEYFRTGLVPRIPTLIVCGFGIMAALLLAASGVILAEMKAKDKRDFEFQYSSITSKGR